MPSPVDHSSGFVTVCPEKDIRIFYRVDGRLDGTKPILLFANSLAASTRLWDGSVAVFGAAYTVVRYDMRFHGQSPPAGQPGFDYAAGHSIEDLAADVGRLLDHLAVAALDAFVGLSIGAAVGLIFGATQPARVRRVVVVGTRATSNATSNTAHATRIAYGRTYGPRALGRQSIARWFDPAFAAAHPDRIAHAEAVYCHQSIDGYQASIAALRTLDLFPYAAAVGRRGDGARFVLVAGELDGTVPAESQALADQMGSSVVIIPNSGHISNIQLPDEFHQVVWTAITET